MSVYADTFIGYVNMQTGLGIVPLRHTVVQRGMTGRCIPTAQTRLLI